MKTTIIAVGNAGGNIVESAMKHSKKTQFSEAKCIFIDDNEHDLSIHDPEGKDSICMHKECITKMRHLFDDSEKVIFVSGLGGLTSEKYLEQLVDEANEAGVQSISVLATIPFLFEGIKRIQRAVGVAKRLNEIKDLRLVLINNEGLFAKHSDLTLFNAFEIADREMMTMLEDFV